MLGTINTFLCLRLVVRSIKLTDEVRQTEGWETRNEGGAKIGDGKTEVGGFGIIEVRAVERKL